MLLFFCEYDKQQSCSLKIGLISISFPGKTVHHEVSWLIGELIG
jgi:hypothetical protein